MNDRVRLAALRALGTVAIPHEGVEIATWVAAANRAGRKLVPVEVAGGPQWAMTWRENVAPEPESPGGPGVPSPNPVIVLAACLRACWPDCAEPLYPGIGTSIEYITEIVTGLGVVQVKRAMNRLVGWGYLLVDARIGDVRLGPRVALWPESDIAYLRSEYELLPHSRNEP